MRSALPIGTYLTRDGREAFVNKVSDRRTNVRCLKGYVYTVPRSGDSRGRDGTGGAGRQWEMWLWNGRISYNEESDLDLVRRLS